MLPLRRITALLVTALALGLAISSGAQPPTTASAAATCIESVILPANTMWTSSCVHVVSSLDVPAGVTLTVESGTIIKIGGGGSIHVQGTLNAVGTSGQHIVITSTRDAPGGTPAPDDWDSIFIDTTDSAGIIRLDYAEVRFGGYRYNGGHGGMIVNSSSSGSLTVTNSDLSWAGAAPIRIANVTNGTNAFASNTAGNNGGGNGVVVSNLSGSATLHSANTAVMPYIIGGLTVLSGTTLTVESGTIIKIGGGGSIHVQGTLNAVGTSGQHIVITSTRDAPGGTPAPDDWDSIFIDTTDSAGIIRLDYAEVRFGGYRYNGGHGGMIVNRSSTGSLTATNGVFKSSGSYAVSNIVVAVVADARASWWDSASGPSSEGQPCNLAIGTGGRVSCNVLFSPWLGSSPSATPTPTPTATPTATAVPPVVVVVHGIDPAHNGDKSCDMEGIQTFLTDQANTSGHPFVSGPAECLIYTSRLGVEAGAKELQVKIDEVKKNRQVDQVDLVVHSMGGLISRYYIERLNGRANVRSLTMLGTPNLGSNSATPVCAAWAAVARLDVFHRLNHPYDQGACDMVPIVSPLLFKLNVFPGSHAGVTYNVLTGWKGQSKVEPPPNDCVVSVLSATGLAFHTELFPKDAFGTPVLHVDSSAAGTFVGCGPTGLGEPNDPAVRARVAQILLESNGYVTPANFAANVGAAVATPTPPPNEPAPSTIGSQSGLVAQSQTIDLPVAMPPSQPTGTFIFRAPDDPSAALAFALLRPGGTPVATTDADVTYESGAGLGGLIETQYVIANPTAGIWTMRVTGTAVPLTGWPYDMQALVPGGVSVSASTGAGHYDVGQSIALSADVAVNATPYAGATVSAMITKPDSTTATVVLADIGGGSYAGSFGDTAACGLYQVTITADGTDSGTPFSRQDRTLAIIGVPGNVILDACTADSDGDGLTDRAETDLTNSNPANADTDGDGVSDGSLIAAPATIAGPDNCPFTPNTAQTNTDAAGNWPWIKDGAPVPEGATLGGDACDSDSDNDGCPNAKEAGADHLAGGDRDAISPWDFADVPVPALSPSNVTGTRDRKINLTGDVLAVLKYVGTSAAFPSAPNVNGAMYGSDLNANGIADGVEYDRTASANSAKPWQTRPPDGKVTLSGDVLTVLRSVGDVC